MDQLSIIAILLICAALLVGVLANIRLDRKVNQALKQPIPEFPDLTLHFVELQQRIASEAEETRKQSTSHAANSQTSIKILADVVKRLPTIDQIKSVIEAEGDALVESIGDIVQEKVESDGQLTRKETQEIKTALRDDEKDDQKAKAKARRANKKGSK